MTRHIPNLVKYIVDKSQIQILELRGTRLILGLILSPPHLDQGIAKRSSQRARKWHGDRISDLSELLFEGESDCSTTVDIYRDIYLTSRTMVLGRSLTDRNSQLSGKPWARAHSRTVSTRFCCP
jgi:hypothetical protein